MKQAPSSVKLAPFQHDLLPDGTNRKGEGEREREQPLINTSIGYTATVLLEHKAIGLIDPL